MSPRFGLRCSLKTRRNLNEVPYGSMDSRHFLVNLVDWLAEKALAAIADRGLVGQALPIPVLASIEQARTDIIRQATLHKWPFVIKRLDDRHIVRRTILKRCIYGFDRNPMAVELAMMHRRRSGQRNATGDARGVVQ